MSAETRTHIKICCIADTTEADMAIGAGADVLGLVSQMPSGPGVIDESMISTIAQHVQDKAETFLLTSLVDPESIIDQHKRCKTTAIQLTDHIVPDDYAELRDGLPGIKLVQVIHVTSLISINDAIAAASHVDALLLDSGNPSLAIKQLGGTGRRHDWTISRQIVESVSVPVYLAGGLRSGNVQEAINAVRPFGLDVCSGVRTHGRLDQAKLCALINTARNV